MSHEPVRRVLIVGGGTAGWIAASILLRVAGEGLSIQLIESDAIGTVGVGEATIPTLQRLNELLGIPEDLFVKVSQATFKLGIEFRDWDKVGDAYIHTFGLLGKDTGLVDFHHYWLKMRQQGKVGPLEEYSINAAMCAANTFARASAKPEHRKSPVARIGHAFHFDSGLFAQFLRKNCVERGVVRTEGRIVSVQQDPETEHVTSVTLDSGEVHAADLYIDCSGFRALLIGQTLGVDFEDWTHWLPCDRAWTVGCESVTPLLPYTRATAHPAGWGWRIPLQHRIGNGHVYSSAHMGDDEARAILLDNLDGPALGEPRQLRFVTGHRTRFMHKNVVAVGLAAGFLEPLESTSIHLIQSALLRLMRMFPNTGFDEADAEAYNRMTTLEFQQVRDFIVLHYHATHRDDTEFWRHVRDMDIPESLSEKMRLFAANGRVFRQQNELFAEDSWVQVLLGQGIMPRGYDPIVDNMTPEDIASMMVNVKGVIGQVAAQMPSHQAFIDEHCKAPPV